MKTRPIIFNGEMVQAILDGRKTQTRRVVKKKRQYIPGTVPHYEPDFPLLDYLCVADCPYGVPDDRLWVRETQWINGGYVATDAPNFANEGKTPSIFMPKWKSRITLEITGVRVERVQDIKTGDVAAEGWPDAPDSEYIWTPEVFRIKEGFEWFQALWDSINAKRGYGWDVNPWVWVVEFKRLED